MRRCCCTGLAALAAAVGLVWAFQMVLPGNTPQVRSAAEKLRPLETAAPQVPEERKIKGFVIHQAARECYDSKREVTVSVEGTERRMALSDYLCGVLMGEMPGSFPLEALKAQAVAARTYTLQRLEAGGALSDDPAECQAFCDPDQAGTKYGEQADAVMEKLRRAVEETDGQVMIYDGTLITATYFSCSGGRTESAQAVWGSSVPYLLSVDSPGEEDADGFESRMELNRSELMERLEIPDTEIREITYTEGGGMETMTIGGRSFSGVELRQRLGLRSTNFQIDISGDTVTVDVKGFGHRVGMSQYGAKAMAERGQSYREILAWYYTGAELTEAV